MTLVIWMMKYSTGGRTFKCITSIAPLTNKIISCKEFNLVVLKSAMSRFFS
jgi:hypothetical protein